MYRKDHPGLSHSDISFPEKPGVKAGHLFLSMERPTDPYSAVYAYSNHNLVIEGYDQAINMIEDILGIIIHDSRYGYYPTDDEAKIIYFTEHDFFSMRFPRFREISVFSNFRICNEISFHEHFVEFALSGEIDVVVSRWRNMISGMNRSDDPSWEMLRSRMLREWERTMEFMISFAGKVGGNTLLFLNDSLGTGAIAREMIANGASLDLLMESMPSPYHYECLENNHKDFADDDWFIDFFHKRFNDVP